MLGYTYVGCPSKSFISKTFFTFKFLSGFFDPPETEKVRLQLICFFDLAGLIVAGENGNVGTSGAFFQMLICGITGLLIGSSSGYEKTLELIGVGYRAALKGNQLNLQLGYSHDINFEIPDGIKVSVEKQTTLKVSGSDKQLVGVVVSKIKTFRKIEPYKGKGIREKGQYVLKKEGKKK